MTRNEHYHDAMYRASYYRWLAVRGFTLHGNDPRTGMLRGLGLVGSATAKAEGRTAYKALAHFWLDIARRIRCGEMHRYGPIEIGENIVLIIVGAEHRADAFKACQWCIDELKKITPIWKMEYTPEGEVWVEEHP